MTPRISFVMPNKDKARFISEAIDSLRNQTMVDIEIIVVDNDSTDASRDILDSFVERDDRISVEYVSLPNDMPDGERIDEARNIGNKRAKAPIICVCDADDIYLPWRAEETYKCFSENQSCGLFYGAFYQRNIYGELDNKIPPLFPAKQFDREVLKKTGFFFIGHITVGYRADLIRKHPYNSPPAGVGDWGMLYNLLVVDKVNSCFTNRPLAIYRVYNNSRKQMAFQEHCDLVKVQELWHKKQDKMKLLEALA